MAEENEIECPCFQNTGENSPTKQICKVLGDNFDLDYDEMLAVLYRIVKVIHQFKKVKMKKDETARNS